MKWIGIDEIPSINYVNSHKDGDTYKTLKKKCEMLEKYIATKMSTKELRHSFVKNINMVRKNMDKLLF